MKEELKKALDTAKAHLTACQDWTSTAFFFGVKSHKEAIDAEWRAYKEVCRLESILGE